MPHTQYKKGDYHADCDVCGFTFWASELRTRWDGMKVCAVDFEERHPQELIRAPRVERPIPWARPQQHQYVTGLSYQLAGGLILADGTITADGSVYVLPEPVYVTFGPVDPDSI